MTIESALEINEQLKTKEEEALSVFKELAPECDEAMEPQFVRYSYDMRKATFYFKSEHRVDFRELLRQLSSRLKISVEMRQIGDREQASLVGGLGPCGQVLCCCKMGSKCFRKNATIKMAKNQDLSLNPTKISGMCGRLMCCLRFENDFYKSFKERAPKLNSVVKTPDGDASVVSIDALSDSVSLKVDEDKPRKISLDDLVENSSSKNGFEVREDAWEEAGQALDSFVKSAVNVSIDTSLFKGDDRLKTSTGAKLSEKSTAPKIGDKPPKKRRRGRRRSTPKGGVTAKRPGGNSSATRNSKKEEVKISRPKREERKPRRRRTTTVKSSK